MEFTPQIQRFGSVSSTNSEAARLALAGATEGLCVIADEQTAGRGRLQRKWISPRGSGLYFSILLRPVFSANRWPLLTLMSAVAVHDALLDSFGLEIDIKWPNDILIWERKLSGILAETIETEYGRAVVVGIGINLSANAFASDLSTTAISVEEASGKPADREIILQALVLNLARGYELLHAEGGGKKIVDSWTGFSSYARGKLIRVSTGHEVIEGTTRGLEADGALRVETIDGCINVIHAGDVVAVRPAG